MFRLTICCAIVASAAISSAALPAAADTGTVVGINTVAWLAGCWSQESATRVVDEHWLQPRAKSMLGVGRTVRDGKLVEYELVLITERNGQLVYEAHPSGQPAAEFVATAATAAAVVFENPAHDYPQQVGYRRSGSDALLAWIQGTVNGAVRRVEFAYQRVACNP